MNLPNQSFFSVLRKKSKPNENCFHQDWQWFGSSCRCSLSGECHVRRDNNAKNQQFLNKALSMLKINEFAKSWDKNISWRALIEKSWPVPSSALAFAWAFYLLWPSFPLAVAFTERPTMTFFTDPPMECTHTSRTSLAAKSRRPPGSTGTSSSPTTTSSSTARPWSTWAPTPPLDVSYQKVKA